MLILEANEPKRQSECACVNESEGEGRESSLRSRAWMSAANSAATGEEYASGLLLSSLLSSTSIPASCSLGNHSSVHAGRIRLQGPEVALPLVDVRERI